MRFAVFQFAWCVACALSTGVQAQTAPQPPAKGAAATPPKLVEKITVTAARGLVGVNDSASSVALLTQEQIQQHAGFALDDVLRSVAGFQLFRRTSSWTANPTTQGLSLRGLGSTAASRTLVVSDQVPLNDPFGGWVHWNEVPLLALHHIEVMRGGAADLYGSSAIGGAVDLVPQAPAEPGTVRFVADLAGASEDTLQDDALLSAGTRRFAVLAAASGLRTNGYIPTAPAQRGVVDAPSNVTGDSGRLELRAPFSGNNGTAFLRGNVLNEARGNGTPLQTNATRLWRYQAGADADFDWGHGVARAFGSRESYRQSFSSIAADRSSERLTRLQRVPTDEFGGVLQASRSFPASLTTALGADLRDIRATDNESSVTANVITQTTSITARQREMGGYADAIWQPSVGSQAWSLSGSVRVDSFRTYAAQQTLSTVAGTTALPNIDEVVVSPRAGLVYRPQARHLPNGLAVTGTAFRAFRGPTMNELYRTGQVGQQTTLANPSLLAERATGFEFGGEIVRPSLGNVRATYFWTEVNRPIAAILLSSTPTSQTLKRLNLGQIVSRGMMIEAHSEAWHGASANAGYQLAIATVTKFNTGSTPQKNLTGNWIPQVPRHSVTAQVVYDSPRVGVFSASAIYSGQQFDDSENLYVLHPYARLDMYAERPVGRGVSLYASAQNLLDRSIEAGRTPVLTLASPRVVQGGVRFRFSH